MNHALLVVVVTGSLAIAAEQRTDQWISLRHDDQRVIFYFAANNTLVTDPPLGPAIPSPVAKYRAGDGLHDLSLERLDKLKLEPNVRVRIGDRYELMLGGNRVSQIEVERLVELPTCTDTFIGAIARVTGDDDAYRTARAKYYVVRQRPGEPLPDRVSTFTGVRPTFDSQRLEANLNSRMQVDLKRISATHDPVLDVPERSALRRRLQTLDQRLAHGDGVLKYDIQSIRISGNLRYYVKAQWAIGGAVGFLMTAWILPDLSIESANSGMSELLRMVDFEHYNLSLTSLPKILNVFSDGTLLVTDEGYESFSISLYRYSAEGLKGTGVTYGYGC
jgi:hypothetical protein